MKRRTFLQALTLGAMNFGLHGIWGCTPIKKLGGAGTKGKAAYCLATQDQKSSTLRVFDWDTHQHEDFSIPIAWPHSLTRDQTDANTVFLFEVFGSCAKINLATKKVVKIDHTRAQEMFIGHAIQTNSGEFLLSSEMSHELDEGIVAIREAKTLRKVGVIPRECNQTHKIAQLPGSNIAACGICANPDGSLGGGITFYDYEKRQVLQKINFEFPIVHLIPISSTEIIGIGAITKHFSKKSTPSFSYERTSLENSTAFSTITNNVSEPRPLLYARPDGVYKTIWDQGQKSLFRQNFGLASIPQNGDFLSSHGDSNSVILWKNFKIAKVFPVPSPTNLVVSYDGTEFLVAAEGKLKLFSLKTLSEIKTIQDERRVFLLSDYPPV